MDMLDHETDGRYGRCSSRVWSFQNFPRAGRTNSVRPGLRDPLMSSMPLRVLKGAWTSRRLLLFFRSSPFSSVEFIRVLMMILLSSDLQQERCCKFAWEHTWQLFVEELLLMVATQTLEDLRVPVDLQILTLPRPLRKYLNVLWVSWAVVLQNDD